MASQTGDSIDFNNAQRLLNVRSDLGKVRDFIYRPSLTGLKRRIDPRVDSAARWSPDLIRDQGTEPNCTAQALAGIIDQLRVRNHVLDDPKTSKEALTGQQPWASEKMLYNIARFHDRFPGEKNVGSSIRGALRGFYFNGVCSKEATKELEDGAWYMTRAILTSARQVQLGAYSRVRPRLTDVHSAINEAGFVLASADLHAGWATQGDKIAFDLHNPQPWGKHAFILIGYTEDGFLVQNSWGKAWGEDGISLWSYEDWRANVVDQWVLRLAVPVTRAVRDGNLQFARSESMRLGFAAFDEGEAYPAPPPTRFEVIGHVASLSRGKLDGYGPYHVEFKTLEETVRIIESKPKYKHVLIHLMGLQRHEVATMAAIRDAIPVMKKNGIYPFFVTLENELSNAVHDLVDDAVEAANREVGAGVSDEKDRWIEMRLAGAAARMVQEIQKASMAIVYDDNGAGEDRLGEGVGILNVLFTALNARHKDGTMSYHFSAHGFGCALLGELFARSDLWEECPPISSVSLMSPMVPEGALKKSLLDLVCDKGDVPLNCRAKADETAIESLDIHLQTNAVIATDRPLDGYSGAWPKLWSRVLALSKRREEGETGLPKDETGRAHVPLLAQSDQDHVFPEHARVTTLRSDALHRDFDLNVEVLDGLVSRILGDETPAMRFAEAFPDRDSLLGDWSKSGLS